MLGGLRSVPALDTQTSSRSRSANGARGPLAEEYFGRPEDDSACTELAAEITAILDSDMTGGQVGGRWINKLNASYEPDRDGLSYRGWLPSPLHVLRATPHPVSSPARKTDKFT